jgi:magnesium chelatase family protein
MRLPADFTLVAATNPCPCGYSGSARQECSCRPHQIKQYRQRLSGPLLDRIDICLPLSSLSPEELTTQKTGETSATVQKRVVAARQRRYSNPTLPLSTDCQYFLKQAVDHYQLSGRGYAKVLALAQTITALASRDMIAKEDIAEACQYRLPANL